MSISGYNPSGRVEFDAAASAVATDGSVTAIAADGRVGIVDGDTINWTGRLPREADDVAVDGGAFCVAGGAVRSFYPDGYPHQSREIDGAVAVEVVDDEVAVVDRSGSVSAFDRDELREDAIKDLPVSDLSEPTTAGGNGLLAVGEGTELAVAEIDAAGPGETISTTGTEFGSRIRTVAILGERIVVGTDRWTVAIDPDGRRRWQVDARLKQGGGHADDALYGVADGSVIRLDPAGEVERCGSVRAGDHLRQSSDGATLLLVGGGELRRLRRRASATVSPERIAEEGGESLAVTVGNGDEDERIFNIEVSLNGGGFRDGDKTAETIAKPVNILANDRETVEFGEIAPTADSDAVEIVVEDRNRDRTLERTTVPVDRAERATPVSASASVVAVTDGTVEHEAQLTNEGDDPVEARVDSEAGRAPTEWVRVDGGATESIGIELETAAHPATLAVATRPAAQSTASGRSGGWTTERAATIDVDAPETLCETSAELFGRSDGSAAIEIVGSVTRAVDGSVAIDGDGVGTGVTRPAAVELEPGDRFVAWLPVETIPVGNLAVDIEICGVDHAATAAGIGVDVSRTVEGNGLLVAGRRQTETVTITNPLDGPLDTALLPDAGLPDGVGRELPSELPAGDTELSRPVASFDEEGDDRLVDGEAIALETAVIVQDSKDEWEARVKNKGTEPVSDAELVFHGSESESTVSVGSIDSGATEHVSDTLPVRFDDATVAQVALRAWYSHGVETDETLAPVVDRPPEPTFSVDVEDTTDHELQLGIGQNADDTVTSVELSTESRTESLGAVGPEETVPAAVEPAAQYYGGQQVTLSGTVGQVDIVEKFFISGGTSVDVNYESPDPDDRVDVGDEVAGRWQLD